MIGSLPWLANGSRSDIPFAVNRQIAAKYTVLTLVLLLIIRMLEKGSYAYLSSTQDYDGILYFAVSADELTSKDMKNVPLAYAYFASKRHCVSFA